MRRLAEWGDYPADCPGNYQAGYPVGYLVNYLVNYHTHTAYCRHAGGTAADYAEEAFEKGLEKLGFSDHLPFPGDPFGYRMPYEEIGAYIADVYREKERYKGRMEILCGFEGEYIRGKEDFYEKLLTGQGCEYLLMGQHMYLDRSGQLCHAAGLSGTEQYTDYAESLAEGMKTGYFCCIAHPDYMFINPFAWDGNCERACDIIIDAAVKEGCCLEYNANGYRRGVDEFEDGLRLQYPHRKFWERAARAGVPVLIGSDCHSPEKLYDAFMDDAWLDAKALGLNIVTDWRGKTGGKNGENA